MKKIKVIALALITIIFARCEQEVVTPDQSLRDAVKEVLTANNVSYHLEGTTLVAEFSDHDPLELVLAIEKVYAEYDLSINGQVEFVKQQLKRLDGSNSGRVQCFSEWRYMWFEDDWFCMQVCSDCTPDGEIDCHFWDCTQL